MKLESISPYEVRVSLTPDDCSHLAEACQIAAEQLVRSPQTQLRSTLTSLAALFQAAGIAAYGKWMMKPDTFAALERELAEVGL